LPMWTISLLVVLYVLISVILVLAVLIQRPQGGGLSTAFGAGAGSGQTAFGTKIGDALTIFTIVVFTLFIGASIALVFLLRPGGAVNETPTISAPDQTPGTTPGTGTPTAPATGTEGTPPPTTEPGTDPDPPTTPPG